MAACRCHLQRPLHILLPQNILEIQNGAFLNRWFPKRLLRQFPFPVQVLCQLPKRVYRKNLRPSGKGCLRRVFRRDEESFHPLLPGCQRHGQHAGHTPNPAVQTEFPQKGTVEPGAADTAAGRKNAQQDRQIIMAACFFHTGRSQIHRDPADGKAQPAAFRRGANPFPGFLDGSIGKPHDVKPRQAVGDKALRRYLGSMNSVYPQSTDAADHTPTPSLFESILSYPIRFKNAIPFSGGGKSHGFPIVIFHRNKEIIGGFSTGGKI